MTLGWSILGYMLFMGLVLAIHEYGHYVAGRYFRFRISRFSIGIGSILWRRASKKSGEWALSSLPIGGYVKFAREGDQGPVSDGTQYMDQAPAHQRLVVLLAGPAANVILAIAALTLGMVIRDEAIAPTLGDPSPSSYLATAGAMAGDTVVSINGRPIYDYADLSLHNITSTLLQRENTWRVLRGDRHMEFTLPPPPVESVPSRTVGTLIGLTDPRRRAPARITDVFDSQNPLRAGDVIKGVAGIPTPSIADLSEQLRGKVGQSVAITIDRDGAALEVTVLVAQHPSRGPGEGALGIEVALPPAQRIDYLGSGPALVTEATRRSWDYIGISFAAAYHLVSGNIGVNSFSGPAQIAHASGQAARHFATHVDPAPVLLFIGVLSISIAAFNLLPIPVLDGGGAVIAMAEIVSRRRIPERAAQVIQYAGLALLGMFFIAAFTSDYLWLINL